MSAGDGMRSRLLRRDPMEQFAQRRSMPRVAFKGAAKLVGEAFEVGHALPQYL